MGNALGHFRTITRHRHAVMRNCIRAGIPWRGFMHDLSKYSPTEFSAGARFYTGTCSPNEGERLAYGFSKAWMHHKGRNRHHFEYWTDYDPKTKQIKPIKMPLKFVIEMFCDRVAASKIYMGENYNNSSTLEYYKRGCKTRVIHPQTAEFLEKLLKMLAEKGEKETFKYINDFRKKNKDY